MEPSDHRAPSIAFVTFSRAEDVPLLNMLDISLVNEGFGSADKFPRIIVDEASSLIPSFDNHCEGRVFTREFPRGDTLNGIECVKGMISVYKEVLAEFSNVDYVCKIDVDTILLNTKFLSVLANRYFHHYGHGINMEVLDKDGKLLFHSPYCKGPCYFMSRGVLDRVPLGDDLDDALIDSNLLSRGVCSMPRPRGYEWPEDEAISWLLFSQDRDLRRFGWDHQLNPFGHLGIWDYTRNGGAWNAPYFDRFRVFDFLEFGKTSTLNPQDYPAWKDRRKVTEQMMQCAIQALSIQ